MRCLSSLVLFCALGACVSEPQPLAFATISGVRIATVDEDGDEWLHDHCVYHGICTVESTAAAVAAAQAQRSNFVEALTRSTDETTWSTSVTYGVALFTCGENPPW